MPYSFSKQTMCISWLFICRNGCKPNRALSRPSPRGAPSTSHHIKHRCRGIGMWRRSSALGFQLKLYTCVTRCCDAGVNIWTTSKKKKKEKKKNILMCFGAQNQNVSQVVWVRKLKMCWIYTSSPSFNWALVTLIVCCMWFCDGWKLS